MADPPAAAEPTTPRIRERVEDFRVEELPLYAPSGEGDHTFVWIEKRERSTEEVARALARLAGVAPREVGYAGRKDRRAVARQWLSVPGLDPARALAFEEEGIRVLEAARHGHKLRVGQLAGNRFELCVRGVGEDGEAAAAALRPRFDEIARRGFANRFGRQRYGRRGDNAAQARALLREGRRPRDRRHLRFLVSALQAEVFDTAIDARTLALDDVAAGEVAQVCESGGLFVVEDVARESERARRFEISATGPIFGTRVLAPTGEPGVREAALLAEAGVDEWIAKARGLRLRGGRRAVRAALGEPSLEAEPGSLRLRFTLASGVYATVFLEALFGGPIDDAPRPSRYPSGSTGETPPVPRQGPTGG